MEIRHVLVPLDQSDLAEAALAYGAHVVSPEGVMTLLMVLEQPGRGSELAPPPDGIMSTKPVVGVTDDAAIRQAWEDAERYLQTVAARLRTPQHEMRTRLEEGRPADRILEVAEDLNIDAIVMSTHGRSGVSRWVFGSVAQKVLSGAPCPVFIVPQRARPGTGDS